MTTMKKTLNSSSKSKTSTQSTRSLPDLQKTATTRTKKKRKKMKNQTSSTQTSPLTKTKKIHQVPTQKNPLMKKTSTKKTRTCKSTTAAMERDNMLMKKDSMMKGRCLSNCNLRICKCRKKKTLKSIRSFIITHIGKLTWQLTVTFLLNERAGTNIINLTYSA